VLDRLRWRLVERRAQELVVQLQKRHKERWIQHVLQGGFHADEAMRRICEAFGLRPELERWVLRLALRKAEQWPHKASFQSSASPSTSEDEALLFHRCEEIAGDRSYSEDEADASDEVHDIEDATGPSKLWRASWRLRVLNTVQKLAPPQVLSKKEVPSDTEEEKLSLSLREAMENAERYAAEARSMEVPEAESPCEQKVETRISFTDSEICFFTIDDDGDTESGEEYTRQLQTKVFDGPSGHKARKASYCWCDEDSDSESEEEDWKDQCDEMAELMGQQRQMVLWSGSWS